MAEANESLYDYKGTEVYKYTGLDTLDVERVFECPSADAAFHLHQELVTLEARATAAEAERDEATRWKDTLLDSAVIHWCMTTENKDDPYKLLTAILNTAIEWDNDPAISERAANQSAKLAAAEERLQVAVDGLTRIKGMWQVGPAYEALQTLKRVARLASATVPLDKPKES